MKRFQIAFAFLRNGEIEQVHRHDNVYVAVISADNEDEALKRFYEAEKFVEMPEILDVIDLGENKLFKGENL